MADFTTDTYSGITPTCVRSTGGYAETLAGALAWFGADTLRRTNKGLLVERAATNYLKDSGDVSTGNWSQQGTSISAGSTAPDGATASKRITVADQYGAFQLVSTPVGAGEAWTLSVYRRPLTAQTLGIGLNGATNANNNRGTATPADSVVWRRDVFATVENADTGIYALPFVVAGDFTGDNGGGNTYLTGSPRTADIWGAQLEKGAPTSYFPTTSAAATRAADAVSFMIPAGVTQLTYTFDDSLTQTVGVTPGASYTIPTTLNRSLIAYIDAA